MIWVSLENISTTTAIYMPNLIVARLKMLNILTRGAFAFCPVISPIEDGLVSEGSREVIATSVMEFHVIVLSVFKQTGERH